MRNGNTKLTKRFPSPSEYIRIVKQNPKNLDPDVADGIFKLFQEINKQGTAILMATHNHELLRKFPYRVLKCEKGKLLDSQLHDVSFGSSF